MAHDLAERAPRRFADLGLRVLSALVLAPIALALLWVGGGAWAVLVAFAAGGAVVEWVRIVGVRVTTLPGVIAPALVATAAFASAAGRAPDALAALGLGAILLLLGAWNVPAGAQKRGGWLAAGLLYAGLAAVAMVWLRLGTAHGRFAALFVVLVVWASDIGAYLFGRLVGGPKLAPRLSPNKTRAGAVGGLVLAAAVGILVAHGFDASSWAKGGAVALVVSLASQSGDLAESALKRRFRVKDSGTLIPGHGGLLDRLDGMLAAAPVAAIIALTWRGAGF